MKLYLYKHPPYHEFEHLFGVYNIQSLFFFSTSSCGGGAKGKRGSWNKRGGWNKRTQLEEEAGVVAPSLPQAVAASAPWVNDVTEEVGHDDAMLDDDVDFLQMMRRFY